MEEEKQKQLLELQKEHKSIIERVKEIVVNSLDTLQDAVSLTKETKRNFDGFEKLRKFHTAGIKKEIKIIEAEYKPFTTTMKEIEGLLKDKIIIYQDEQEKKFKKEAVKAEKKGEEAPPPPPPIHIEKEKISGLTMKKVWNYDVVDIAKVPATFSGVQILIVDSKAVRKFISAGIREIPGLRIHEESASAISSKESLEDL